MRIMESLVRGQLAVQDGAKAVQARLVREEGASAVEYALMVGLIAVVIIAGVTILGQNINKKFSSVASSV